MRHSRDRLEREEDSRRSDRFRIETSRNECGLSLREGVQRHDISMCPGRQPMPISNKRVSGERTVAANIASELVFFQKESLHDLHKRAWRDATACPDDKTLVCVGS
jgi:hypothetical protein